MSDPRRVGAQYEAWLRGYDPVSLYMRWYLRHRGPREADALWAALGTGEFPRLLDVGCAGGFFLADAWRRGQGRGLLAGVDVSPTLIAEAERRLTPARTEGASVALVTGDASAIPFPDGAFDAVVSVGMVKYLDDAGLASFLAEARRVLAPDGRLAVAEFARRVGWGRRVRLDRFGVPGDGLRSGAELAQALRAAGFDAVNEFDVPRIRRIPLTFEGACGTRV